MRHETWLRLRVEAAAFPYCRRGPAGRDPKDTYRDSPRNGKSRNGLRLPVAETPISKKRTYPGRVRRLQLADSMTEADKWERLGATWCDVYFLGERVYGTHDIYGEEITLGEEVTI